MKYELDINEYMEIAKKTQWGRQFSDASLRTLYDYYTEEQESDICGAITNLNDIFMMWDEYGSTKEIAEDYEIETDYEHGDPLYDDQVQLYCHDEGMEMVWVDDDLILLRTGF